jgi:hypothetical protein
MSGAILPLPQYALMTWCSAKKHGQLYLYLFTSILDDGPFYLIFIFENIDGV